MFGNSQYRPHRLGLQAENAAKTFLEKQGLKTKARNFHCRQGEIDLIMWDQDSLVFVEVRYRRQNDYGSALESVDRRKQRRILRCAEYYLLRHPELRDRRMRFDVVSVAIRDGETGDIDWIRHAFDAS